MLDATQTAQVRAAILANEGAQNLAYQLTYAQKGNSGASVGRFQGDLSKQPAARNAVQAALVANGMGDDDARAIVGKLTVVCGSSPLTAAEDAAVAAALATEQGRALIDAMDEGIIAGILVNVTACQDSAQAGNRAIDNGSLCAMGCWINMTGAPNTMRHWLAGNAVSLDAGDVPAPPSPTVTLAATLGYLQKSKYFAQNPRNFQHLQASIAAGLQASADMA